MISDMYCRMRSITNTFLIISWSRVFASITECLLSLVYQASNSYFLSWRLQAEKHNSLVTPDKAMVANYANVSRNFITYSH